jgi:hypothetical protein
MWRKLSIVGLGIFLLLAVLLLVNWDSVRVGYYRWQLKTAEEAMTPESSCLDWIPGLGDPQTRYRRARQALLDLGDLQELILLFPDGSNSTGLIQQCRKRFPEGGWAMTFDNSRHALRLTVPTAHVATWKTLVAEFSAP